MHRYCYFNNNFKIKKTKFVVQENNPNLRLLENMLNKVVLIIGTIYDEVLIKDNHIAKDLKNLFLESKSKSSYVELVQPIKNIRIMN